MKVIHPVFSILSVATIKRLSIFLFITTTAPVFSQSPNAGPLTNLQPLSVDSQKLQSGLYYIQYYRDAHPDLDPLRIHVLAIKKEYFHFEVGLALDQVIGQETTSHMVTRKGAIAGINGGFSFSNNPWTPTHGDPKDLFVLNGRILSEPYKTRASIGFENVQGKQLLFVDQLFWKGVFCPLEGTCLKLTGINRSKNSNDLVLYTPEYNRSTITKGKGFECIYENDSLVFSKKGGSSFIPPNGFVISASGRYVDSLSTAVARSKKGTYKHQLFSNITQKPFNPHRKSIQTAGPILVKNQTIVIDSISEQIPSSFVLQKHPRSGIGYNQNQSLVFFVVVDGRQPKWSMGIDLYQFAQFFLDLGAVEAYNLDGGGSSTLVYKDEILNRPSDQKERRRCDALLLFKK